MGRPRKTRDEDILVARTTGVVNLDGKQILLRRGVTRARAGSAVARAYPTHFKPIDVHFEIEQATDAPGEKRGA